MESSYKSIRKTQIPNRKVGEEAQQTISQKKKYRWLIKFRGKKSSSSLSDECKLT